MHKLLTPWCRVLLEKLTGLQLVKKFPAFHRTRRFITALTSVRHLSLSWASPIQSIYPHPTSWSSILILSTHLRLGLPSGLLPSGFPTKTLYTPLSSPTRATCPAHLILPDFITQYCAGDKIVIETACCEVGMGTLNTHNISGFTAVTKMVNRRSFTTLACFLARRFRYGFCGRQSDAGSGSFFEYFCFSISNIPRMLRSRLNLL